MDLLVAHWVAYIYLQLKADTINIDYEEYRRTRMTLLEVACGAAKNKFKNLQSIIGICTEPPKLNRQCTEDFMAMDCSNWDDKTRDQFIEANEKLGFFKTGKKTIIGRTSELR